MTAVLCSLAAIAVLLLVHVGVILLTRAIDAKEILDWWDETEGQGR